MVSRAITKFSVELASSATLTSALDLGAGWGNVALEVPSFASATDLYLQGAGALTDTYRRLAEVAPATASVELNDFRIGSGVSGRFVQVPNWCRFIKVEASTAPATSYTLNVICKD